MSHHSCDSNLPVVMFNHYVTPNYVLIQQMGVLIELTLLRWLAFFWFIYLFSNLSKVVNKKKLLHKEKVPTLSLYCERMGVLSALSMSQISLSCYSKVRCFHCSDLVGIYCLPGCSYSRLSFACNVWLVATAL